MLEQLTRALDTPHLPGAEVVSTVRDLSARELAPLVHKIDAEGFYPEDVMRAFGRAGAFAAHLPGSGSGLDLVTAIRAMAAAGEHCLSTSFCMWCQDASGTSLRPTTTTSNRGLAGGSPSARRWAGPRCRIQ